MNSRRPGIVRVLSEVSLVSCRADWRRRLYCLEPARLRPITTMTGRLAFKDRATRDSMTWVTADGVHADEGGQVSLDRLEDYLTTLA